MITPELLILADTIITQIVTLSERLTKIRTMNDEEVKEALIKENERSKQLKILLEK